MSHKLLPIEVKPFKLAEQSSKLSGELSLEHCSRLAERICDDDLAIRADLLFALDMAGTATMTGAVQTKVTLTCQRCMDEMDLAIESNLTIAWTRDQAIAKQSIAGCETIVVEGDLVMLHDIIEDEILLSLPIIPKHNSADCHETVPLEPAISTVKRNNVFDKLAELKTKSSVF